MTAQAVGTPSALRTSSPPAVIAPAVACAPGRQWPLGATLGDGGVNFAVYASSADRVEVCVFDAQGQREVQRIPLPCRTDDVWHGFVTGLAAGTRYGLRVHGPYDPHHGWRCNAHKLMLDPYARALDRPLRGAARGCTHTSSGNEAERPVVSLDDQRQRRRRRQVPGRGRSARFRLARRRHADPLIADGRHR